MVSAGDRLGGHLLIEAISGEEPACVWLARAPTGEQVMLWVAPVSESSVDSERESIEAGTAAVGNVAHANVARVLGGGVELGVRYVVNAYPGGLFLSDLLAAGRSLGIGISPGVAGHVALQLCRALGVLQAAAGADGRALGRLPRVLHPGGIVVGEDGVVRIADLVPGGDDQLAYAAPESPADGRSDLFSVGAILWEMFVGRRLFATRDEVLSADVSALPSFVPSRLAALTMRCLARDPSERYEKPAVLEASLEAAVADQPDANDAGVAAYVAEVRNARSKSGKPGTARLSEASQSGTPRHQRDRTVPSNPPSAAIRAATDIPPPSVTPKDEFFDVERDGGGISNPRFEVLGRLGSGGMGEVYRVRDHELNEIVALKKIPAHTAGEMQSLERLKREVRLARRIASDHVCRIFDLVDLGHGSRGLTMALIDGVTLSELMKAGLKVDYMRFARWAADIADGLAAAHAVDIIHRDLKPENVMIDSKDRAVILDFGIARSQAETTEVDGKLTQAGIIMGTPLYMSPEQLMNRDLDGRSDLYSLGLLLGELICGEVPMYGENYGDIVDRRVVRGQSEPYRVADVDPGVPKALGGLIDRLLAPGAEDRPGDAIAVRDELRVVAGIAPAPSLPPEPIPIPPAVDSTTPTPTPVPKPASQSKWYGMIAVLVVLIVILGIWVARGPTGKVAPVRDAGVAPAVVDAGVAPPPPRDGGVVPRDGGVKRKAPPPEVIEM